MPLESWRQAVRETLDAVKRRWPGVAVDEAAFVARVEELADGGDVVAAVGDWNLEELFLAQACAVGDDEALAILEREHMPAVMRGVRRLDLASDEVEEVAQRVRAKLLVGSEGVPPKIASYAGRGPLGSWLRVTGLREGLTLARGAQRARKREVDVFAERMVDEAEPELEALRHQYRGEVEAALTAAFESLNEKQQTLMRMYVLDGLSVSALGAFHDVDGSTISRWLKRIKADLLAATQRHLVDELGLRPSECDSVIRAVRSELDVSVERLLRQ